MKRPSRQSLGFFFVAYVAIRERLPFIAILVIVGVGSLAAFLLPDATPELPALPESTLTTKYQVMWGGCEFLYVTEGDKVLELTIADCSCVPESDLDKSIGFLPDSHRPVYISEWAGERYVVDTLPRLRSRNGFRFQISCR